METDRNMLVVNPELRIPLWEIQFSFARSSGPGGQNVNKVNSKAVLRWTPAWNQSLPEAVRMRFLARYAGKLTNDGELVLSCEEFRDQKRNQEGCLEKLRELVRAVARPPKVRRPTKPTRGSQERRKDSKTRRGEVKKGRGKIRWD
jgi:ribosome-associated protein